MNKYEQYLHTQRKDTAPNGFKVGDRIVWRYHSRESPWYGTIELIDAHGRVYCRGAWSERSAFEGNRNFLGTGHFEPERTDGYLEHYIGEYNEQI